MSKLQDFLSSPIPDVSQPRVRAKPGDLFGVELECEGRNVDWNGVGDLLKDWQPHPDGSLRNNHGSSCEWVFNGPAKFAKSVERVGLLFDYFESRKAKLVCSNRTSTHVHFNMGDKSAYQLVNMFILFTIFEDIFDRYCGEDRRGNLFCLSSRHAEAQVAAVTDSVVKHFSFNNIKDDFRYCSLNLAAINKFGTVEFRAMRGLDNRDDIVNWLTILNEFCDYACYKMKNPVTVVEQVSVLTPAGFMREVFSAKSYKLLTDKISEYEINASIYEGLRLVQMLCYRVGTEFDQVRLRGRDFWASLNPDQEPMLDVDPERPVKAPQQRGARIQVAEPGIVGPIRAQQLDMEAMRAPNQAPAQEVGRADVQGDLQRRAAIEEARQRARNIGRLLEQVQLRRGAPVEEQPVRMRRLDNFEPIPFEDF